MQISSRRHSSMALPKQYIQSVEIQWCVLVAIWHTCVHLVLYRMIMSDHLLVTQRAQGKVYSGSSIISTCCLVELTLILSSSIIRDIIALRDSGQASIAYFYFDFRDIDKQKPQNLLASLLIQLSFRSDPRCDVLSRLFRPRSWSRETQ
jgi:hypothetical protein